MIAVVDYGAGNIGSVLNMIHKVGGKAAAVSAVDDLLAADKILLPGVGSYDNAMSRLTSLGLVEVLKARAADGVAFLGICLGMQLLADSSEEGVLPGLGIIPGCVKRFRFEGDLARLKIPHMGWNRVHAVRPHPLVNGLEQDARFYFVHSYYFDCVDLADRLFEAEYGLRFTCGVQRLNVMGVQFHPEKSHRYGMQLMKNFIEL